MISWQNLNFCINNRLFRDIIFEQTLFNFFIIE